MMDPVILTCYPMVAREITHVAAQSVHEYVWRGNEIKERETGDCENRTHILPIVNRVWRYAYLHAGAHVNYYIVRLTRMWRFGMI